MKRLLVISGILSWLNLIIWGLAIAMGTLSAILYMNIQLIIFIFIISSIVLHSYAALKLRRSLKDPGIPLGSQTPVGIRLMGAVTLFLGIIYISQGIAILQNMTEVVKDLQPMLDSLSTRNSMPAKSIHAKNMVLGISIFSILAGLSCAGNAILNFRMLRGYLFSNQQEQK